MSVGPRTRDGARVNGVVFDLDSTLVDNIRFHFASFREMARRLGKEMDEATFQSFNGLKNEDIFPRFVGRTLTREELTALSDEKEQLYRTEMRPHRAPELLARLRDAGIKLAVASSAPPANRTMVLEGLGWTSTFDAVVASEGLRGKPAPDVFLAAAERIGIAPAECLAFEDAENGVQSAVHAGMTVVGVTTNVAAAALLGAGARFTVEHFASLPAELEALLPD